DISVPYLAGWQGICFALADRDNRVVRVGEGVDRENAQALGNVADHFIAVGGGRKAVGRTGSECRMHLHADAPNGAHVTTRADRPSGAVLTRRVVRAGAHALRSIHLVLRGELADDGPCTSRAGVGAPDGVAGRGAVAGKGEGRVHIHAHARLALAVISSRDRYV